MDPESILKLILFGIGHWVLAIMLLHDLANRKRVRGGRKWPWAMIILFFTFFGALLYLLFHPEILLGGDEKEGS